MSLLGCLAITEGYIVAYLLPPFYRKKFTLSTHLDLVTKHSMLGLYNLDFISMTNSVAM